MKIEKIKKLKSGKYKLELNDGSSLTLFDEVILTNNLLFKKEIDGTFLNKLYKDNDYYDNYNKVLKYIKIKMRSSYEIKKYMNKLEISSSDQAEILKKLTQINLINDELFVKAFIGDRIYLTNDGPNKIKNELLKYEISEYLIEQQLKNYNPELFESKIKNIISKKIKANNNYSSYIIKQRIINYLLNLGYEREAILFQLNDLHLDNDKAIKNEYQKLLKKLSRKYDGEELKYQVKNRLYQKGFTTDDINQVI